MVPQKGDFCVPSAALLSAQVTTSWIVDDSHTLVALEGWFPPDPRGWRGFVPIQGGEELLGVEQLSRVKRLGEHPFLNWCCLSVVNETSYFCLESFGALLELAFQVNEWAVL